MDQLFCDYCLQICEGRSYYGTCYSCYKKQEEEEEEKKKYRESMNMCEISNVKAAMSRLLGIEGGCMMFPNKDKTLRIFIRAVDDVDPPMTYDVVELGVKTAMYEETLPETHPNLLNYGFPGGYYDDEFDVIIVQDFKNLLREGNGYENFLKEVETLWRSRVCECGDRLILDDYETCVFCQMMEDGKKKEMCCVCHEEGNPAVMTEMSCCKAMLHKTCLRRWSTVKKEKVTCPWCRAEQTSSTLQLGDSVSVTLG